MANRENGEKNKNLIMKYNILVELILDSPSQEEALIDIQKWAKIKAEKNNNQRYRNCFVSNR